LVLWIFEFGYCLEFGYWPATSSLRSELRVEDSRVEFGILDICEREWLLLSWINVNLHVTVTIRECVLT